MARPRFPAVSRRDDSHTFRGCHALLSFGTSVRIVPAQVQPERVSTIQKLEAASEALVDSEASEALVECLWRRARVLRCGHHSGRKFTKCQRAAQFFGSRVATRISECGFCSSDTSPAKRLGEERDGEEVQSLFGCLRRFWRNLRFVPPVWSYGPEPTVPRLQQFLPGLWREVRGVQRMLDGVRGQRMPSPLMNLLGVGRNRPPPFLIFRPIFIVFVLEDGAYMSEQVALWVAFSAPLLHACCNSPRWRRAGTATF